MLCCIDFPRQLDMVSYSLQAALVGQGRRMADSWLEGLRGESYEVEEWSPKNLFHQPTASQYPSIRIEGLDLDRSKIFQGCVRDGRPIGYLSAIWKLRFGNYALGTTVGKLTISASVTAFP